MKLPIYLYGHPILREETIEIDAKYPDLKKLIEDMYETMYDAEGIGLAAPQIGKAIRLMVIDADVLAEDFPECKDFKKVFINPKITKHNDEEVSLNEGCLSIPGIQEKVSRPTEITVEYLDEELQPQTIDLTGFAARVFQHEFDHIEQTLFTDRISPMRKQMIKSKLSKISQGQVNCHYRTVCKR
ncbi:peptide deformylase [Porphyromonas sp.]|uniref:peptide deformylase n=1 Tax=Porphyromonas sp. TaxID=1924944 RepID=UPI0026DBB1C3|nr:peptide deformylase [Porphyromonas sp.]MDO4695483.1 peptide deformylase [Porphyromonas sp.]MDO4770283.1 peptide deformylase [Porphyromonas sp.]